MKPMVAICLPFLATCSAIATYSSWMAASIVSRSQGVMTGSGGSSELLQAGFTQKAFAHLIEAYPDEPWTSTFSDYITTSADSVTSFLSNATKDTTYPLDRFSNGNALISLTNTTQNSNATIALSALVESLDLQTRNPNGGLWYYVYPYWSYLDGMFSYAPFYAMYIQQLATSEGDAAKADIYLQLSILWERCYMPSNCLLVHGYDYSKTAVWANPETGASPHVWGRSLGWYAMAVVDVLESLEDDRDSSNWRDLHCRTLSLLSAIVMAADPATGAWWQVMDRPGEEGNYIESSGSAMFIYALLRAERLGLTSSKECDPTIAYAMKSGKGIALRAYDYLVDTFVVDNGNGTLGYNGTVSVCSLNSTASYKYYVGQPLLYNSVLGSAAFVLASIEVEQCKR